MNFHIISEFLTRQAADFAGLSIAAVDVRAVITRPSAATAGCRRQITIASATMRQK